MPETEDGRDAPLGMGVEDTPEAGTLERAAKKSTDETRGTEWVTCSLDSRCLGNIFSGTLGLETSGDGFLVLGVGANTGGVGTERGMR